MPHEELIKLIEALSPVYREISSFKVSYNDLNMLEIEFNITPRYEAQEMAAKLAEILAPAGYYILRFNVSPDFYSWEINLKITPLPENKKNA